MASKLVIDLDTLTGEKAKAFAGIILAFADLGDVAETETPVDPAAAFGPAAPMGIVSTTGPMLVIPQEVPPPPPPVTVAPPASTVGVTVSTDKAGLPWDGRIHASSKTTNTDGTWRLKRNVDKTLVDSVNAELQRAMAAPGPQLVPPPPPPAAGTVPPPPPPAEPSADSRKLYVDLVGRAASAQGAGKISVDQINKCLSALGVDNMPSLGHRLDLVPAACNLIDGIIAGAGA